ncbi:hypothetical protein [Anaerosinus sp.]
MKIDNKERVFMIEFLKDRTEQIALKAIEHLKNNTYEKLFFTQMLSGSDLAVVGLLNILHNRYLSGRRNVAI